MCFFLALRVPLLKGVVSPGNLAKDGQSAMEPPPKKLRGWKKEMAETLPCEKGAASSPSCSNTTSSTSPLCTRLLELWSLGKLSATQVQEISHLALLEGCSSPEIHSLAKCGNFGQTKGNIHRDLVCNFCKNIHISDPIKVTVDVLDTNSRKIVKEEASIFLPHMMFSQLAEHHPDNFAKFFCFQEATSFWKNVQHVQDPRLAPPLSLDKRVVNPAKTCPIFIHGDGVEYSTRDSLMTWSWGPMLSSESSLSSHLLLLAFPKSSTVPTTWDPINAWVCWSLAALCKGFHPSTDPFGHPLRKGMAELAGLPLTSGGHRCFIWSIQGDLEFCSNVLKLPHWQNKFPCHECDAQRPVHKGIRCPDGKSVKLLREEDQNYVFVSPQQALLEKRSSHPLFSIEGVSTALVRGDSLHILYSRGVASHLAGSLLHYLAYYDGTKRQKVNPSQRINTMFSRIKQLYAETKVTSRLTNLRLSMVTDPSKPHKNFACLEAKAGETKHFLPCLLQLIKEALPEEVPIHETMIGCLSAFIEIQDLYDEIGMFPSAAEYGKACSLAKRFFDSYHDLNKWALLKGRKLFNVTHKFHSFKHLLVNSRFLNFRAHCNFKAEHFVGQISVLSHSCSFGVKTSKLCSKVNLKYRFLLHLQITRPGFGQGNETSDP